MEPDRPVIAWTRALLNLPAASGERFSEEWKIVARRIEAVHTLSVSRDTEPAGAPRLQHLLAVPPNPVGSSRRGRPPDE
jgi:hypothetical protein